MSLLSLHINFYYFATTIEKSSLSLETFIKYKICNIYINMVSLCKKKQIFYLVFYDY